MTGGPVHTTPLFRWAGQYWGFLAGDRLHDRHGRHVGWVEPRPGQPPEVYHLSGHFLGELVDHHYVLRHVTGAEPSGRGSRAPVPCATPPDPEPARDPRDPRDDWVDALPWPLPPPEPPSR
jgi:hypothetical protein